MVNDLLSFGWELWDLLDHHAHAETYAVQRCLDRLLPAQDDLAVAGAGR